MTDIDKKYIKLLSDQINAWGHADLNGRVGAHFGTLHLHANNQGTASKMFTKMEEFRTEEKKWKNKAIQYNEELTKLLEEEE